eukprot:854158_1
MRSLPVLAFLYGVYVATILTVLDAADPKAPNVKCSSGACTIEYDFVTSTTTTEPEIKRKEDTDAYTFKNGDKIEIEKDADVFLTSMKPEPHFWFKKPLKEDAISYYIHSV